MALENTTQQKFAACRIGCSPPPPCWIVGNGPNPPLSTCIPCFSFFFGYLQPSNPSQTPSSPRKARNSVPVQTRTKIQALHGNHFFSNFLGTNLPPNLKTAEVGTDPSQFSAPRPAAFAPHHGPWPMAPPGGSDGGAVIRMCLLWEKVWRGPSFFSGNISIWLFFKLGVAKDEWLLEQ